MELRRLKLINFRQHAETEFELGPGLTAIIGPNGAGKSTLLEAIAWAFYGNPAARGSRDSIRWRRAPARSKVSVEVDFRLGAHEYQVARGLYDAQLYQDRGSSPISSGTQEVTAVVTRLLGMTHDEFFNTYFTGQKELAVMAALGPAERGRFLSRVLGYERLRTAQDAVREQKSRLRAELSGLEHGLGDADELERELKAAEKRYRDTEAAMSRATAAKEAADRTRAAVGPEWTRMTEVRQTSRSLESDRAAAEHQVTDARREFDRMDRELAAALDAQARLRELQPALTEVEPLRKELERLEIEGRSAARRIDLTGQLKEVAAQRTRLQGRLSEIAGASASMADAEAALEQTRRRAAEAVSAEEAARNAWIRDKEHARTRREELRQQYLDVKEQRDRVTEAGPTGLCPTCGRALGKDYEQLVATFTRQLEEIEGNGQYFRQRMAQLEAEPSEVQDAAGRRAAVAAELEKAQQALADARAASREGVELEREEETLGRRATELSRLIAELPERYDADRHDQVRDRLRELEPAAQQAGRLMERAERAATLVSEMEAAERRLSEREQRVRDLTSALAALGFSEAKYQESRERFERAEAAVHAAELELVAQRGELRAADGARSGARKRLEERAARAARIDDLRTEMRMHEELDAAFGELRTDLNAQMRPDLSDAASSLISELTDQRYTDLDLDDNYEVTLVSEGLPVSSNVLSGGEEDVANLVLRVAISQLAAERAGQPLSLLVLDEIFGSLDEHRRERVIGLMRGLADRFPQVVLITHIESVRSYTMDRVLRVSLDERRGVAMVTEESGDIDQLAAETAVAV